MMQPSLLRLHSLQLVLQLALLLLRLLRHHHSRTKVQTQTAESHQRLSESQPQPRAGSRMPPAAQLHQIGRTANRAATLRQQTRRRTTVFAVGKRQSVRLQLQSQQSLCGTQTTQQRLQRGSGTWHGRSERQRKPQSRFRVDGIDQT
jgi:hypothetical protein